MPEPLRVLTIRYPVQAPTPTSGPLPSPVLYAARDLLVQSVTALHYDVVRFAPYPVREEDLRDA